MGLAWWGRLCETGKFKHFWYFDMQLASHDEQYMNGPAFFVLVMTEASEGVTLV